MARNFGHKFPALQIAHFADKIRSPDECWAKIEVDRFRVPGDTHPCLPRPYGIMFEMRRKRKEQTNWCEPIPESDPNRLTLDAEFFFCPTPYQYYSDCLLAGQERV